jgi:putative glutamine amidotransferase
VQRAKNRENERAVGRIPLVAIPAYPVVKAGRIQGWPDAGVAVPARYVEALRRAGGREAIVLPTAIDDDGAAALLDRVDGLLLIGGGDLDPATYGEEPNTRIYGVNAERDACELALTRAAIARRTPVLAICRGCQVLDVASGGTLDQHITGREGLAEHGVPGVADGAREHPIDVEPASRLADAVGATHVMGSSHHHQAVARVGDGLRVVARAPDGVVEGIEAADPAGPWIVGVQWHPEDTAATDAPNQHLFDTFVSECASR